MKEQVIYLTSVTKLAAKCVGEISSAQTFASRL